jgi:hypothetical protein
MKTHQNIRNTTQRQGRPFATTFGLSILFALLVVALMMNFTTTSKAHAATVAHTYTIASGDTLGGIADRYGVSVSDLAAANGIANPDLIYPGTTLQIPAGGSTSAPATHAPTKLHGSYADMIHQVFGSYGNGAVHVAMCESSMNPRAYNGILGAAGLFQIIPGTFAGTSYRGQSVYDPVVNIKAAHEIFVRDGHSWRGWACKP